MEPFQEGLLQADQVGKGPDLPAVSVTGQHQFDPGPRGRVDGSRLVREQDHRATWIMAGEGARQVWPAVWLDAGAVPVFDAGQLPAAVLSRRR
jgi:hypothetical protein